MRAARSRPGEASELSMVVESPRRACRAVLATRGPPTPGACQPPSRCAPGTRLGALVCTTPGRSAQRQAPEIDGNQLWSPNCGLPVSAFLKVSFPPRAKFSLLRETLVHPAAYCCLPFPVLRFPPQMKERDDLGRLLQGKPGSIAMVMSTKPLC